MMKSCTSIKSNGNLKKVGSPSKPPNARSKPCRKRSLTMARNPDEFLPFCRKTSQLACLRVTWQKVPLKPLGPGKLSCRSTYWVNRYGQKRRKSTGQGDIPKPFRQGPVLPSHQRTLESF